MTIVPEGMPLVKDLEKKKKKEMRRAFISQINVKKLEITI